MLVLSLSRNQKLQYYCTHLSGKHRNSAPLITRFSNMVMQFPLSGIAVLPSTLLYRLSTFYPRTLSTFTDDTLPAFYRHHTSVSVRGIQSAHCLRSSFVFPGRTAFLEMLPCKKCLPIKKTFRLLTKPSYIHDHERINVFFIILTEYCAQPREFYLIFPRNACRNYSNFKCDYLQ